MICSSKFNMGKSVNKTQWANIMMLNNMYFANFRRNNQVYLKRVHWVLKIEYNVLKRDFEYIYMSKICSI